MKAYLRIFQIFSIFVNILFLPMNMNMHSCPVKSVLLPLQLLKYGVCPKFVFAGCVLQGQLCEKSYGASLER